MGDSTKGFDGTSPNCYVENVNNKPVSKIHDKYPTVSLFHKKVTLYKVAP